MSAPALLMKSCGLCGLPIGPVKITKNEGHPPLAFCRLQTPRHSLVRNCVPFDRQV